MAVETEILPINMNKIVVALDVQVCILVIFLPGSEIAGEAAAALAATYLALGGNSSTYLTAAEG